MNLDSDAIAEPAPRRRNGKAPRIHAGRIHAGRLSRRERAVLDLLAGGGEMAAGRRWKARWVRLRGTWAFWAVVVGLLPLPVVDWLLQRWA